MSTAAAPLLSRHLGDYLLVAQLSDDALGSVFRALHAADERRFVRLRILRSNEFPAGAIETAIRESAARSVLLAHPAIVDRPLLDVVEGIPFMTWDETSGWTLDAMLARVRAFGIRIPAEYALLIVERIAAALEHAHRTSAEGRAAHHGLLWPGFVSISHDAAVRVGGFGLAEAVLPSLLKPRLAAEVAPYLAPELRAQGVLDPRADVYSLGVILAELLTGRRPTADAPPPELRAGDPRSDELETFLHRCMAPRETRFASAVDAHREIQRMVTGNPFSLYTANLALFLYKLLNPESQLAAPSSDWESTNPVVIDGSSTLSTRRKAAAELSAVAEPIPTQPAATPAPTAAQTERIEAAEPSPILEDEPLEVAAAFHAVAALEASAAAEEARVAQEPAERASVAIEPAGVVEAEADGSSDVFLVATESQAPDATVPALELPGAPFAVPPVILESPVRLWASAWTRPASALATAAGLSLVGFLLVSQARREQPLRRQPALAISTQNALAPLPAAVPAALEPAAPALHAPEVSAAAAAPVAVVLSGSTGRFEPAASGSKSPSRSGKPVPAPSRQPAENLRLRAALARIEADRVNAQQTAGDLFGEGRHSEQEGERLLRERDFQAAELAFSRAARLFQQAQEISWERRLRDADLTNAQ